MFVYLFCIGGVALAMGGLHALRHFTAPAFAPVLLNVAMIACALGLSAHLAEPVMSLAYGVVIGGACQLLWQIPALVRRGISLRLRWQPRHPALRRIGVLLLPLVFGTGVFQINQIIQKGEILTHMLQFVLKVNLMLAIKILKMKNLNK